MYLFGGRNLEGCLGDLWVFDPGNGGWEPIATGAGPSARSGAGLIWDPEGGRLVLYGGYCHDRLGRLHFFRDVWWFEPRGGWSREFLKGGPGPRAWHAMALQGRRVVVFGGSGPAPREYLQDVWELDLEALAWRRLATDGGPRMAGRPAVVPAPGDDERLEVLGRDGIPRPDRAGIWTLSLSGQGWTGPAGGGGGREGPPVDFHVAAVASGGLRVLLAGPDATRDGWDVWWQAGARSGWFRARPLQGPACPAGMACAPEHGAPRSLVCFGGARREVLSAKTWRLRLDPADRGVGGNP